MSLTVRIITPDKIVWDEAAQEVILPSTTGQLGILKGHVPLLTALDVGVMRVRPGKDWQNIAVMGGFAEVENDEIRILVNGAELGSKIDKEEAKKEFAEAQQHLDEATKSGDRQKQFQATQTLRRAKARFQAAGGMV